LALLLLLLGLSGAASGQKICCWLMRGLDWIGLGDRWLRNRIVSHRRQFPKKKKKEGYNELKHVKKRMLDENKLDACQLFFCLHIYSLRVDHRN
jgi:hypothetical protein